MQTCPEAYSTCCYESRRDYISFKTAVTFKVRISSILRLFTLPKYVHNERRPTRCAGGLRAASPQKKDVFGFGSHPAHAFELAQLGPSGPSHFLHFVDVSLVFAGSVLWCLGGKLERSELITMQTSHVGWYCSVREFVCLVTALAPWFPSNPGLLYRYSRLSVTPLVDQELWRVARCVIDSVLPVPVPI
jgi:hypothetical protein